MNARHPKIGDNVQITLVLTAKYRQLGTIVDIRTNDPHETMPYVVEFPNYDRLPYAENEFEFWSNNL